MKELQLTPAPQRRNQVSAVASPEMMNTHPDRDWRSRRKEAADGPALWIALAAGLLILLAAAVGRAEGSGFSATRTDRFSAALPANATISRSEERRVGKEG